MRLNRRRGAVCAREPMRRGRVTSFEISAPCTATFKEIPIASAISATVRRFRLRPPAKSCDTNPLVLPRHFATSELVSPRCSTASDNASVTSRISFSPGTPTHKTGTGFAGAKLSEILRLRSRCSLAQDDRKRRSGRQERNHFYDQLLTQDTKGSYRPLPNRRWRHLDPAPGYRCTDTR